MWPKGPPPLPEATPSPTQVGRAASFTRTEDRAVRRLCLRAVLVAEVDERRSVQATSQASHKLTKGRAWVWPRSLVLAW
jgi:hypothetical protein